ncbi:MAG: ThuA domain-containing protein [Verrucomicrobia bacterium]|nr:ThuA domain-containing protein [Verrucomicrobiota bacterium]
MKIQLLPRSLLLAGLAFLGTSGWTSTGAAAPKKLLLVTTTVGFPHSSIPTAEKVLADLGQKSGVFTVDIVRSGPRPRDKAEQAAWLDKMTKDLGEKMNPEALKQYDGIIFANTTGILPVPDKDAFLTFIKSGKAFIGMHSASDTFHGKDGVDPYIEMLGGEFQTHGAQAGVECLVQDTKHPATRHFAKVGDVYCLEVEEIYLFKNYQLGKVHELLVLDKHPNKKKELGHFPVAWCKEYGKGKVFYTSLGHREDVWENQRYQDHILGGIKWALGLEPGDATPQAR